MPRRLAPDSLADGPPISRYSHGTLLEGRFELLDVAGRGGMGTVWKARDREHGEIVAVKILAVDGATPHRRFRREYRTLARLDHPNVVTVRSYHDGPPPFFVMDHVEGVAVTDWVGRAEGHALNAPERLARVRAALVQILRGLAHIHSHGLVHRDLKPDNLLVTASGELRIVDFGVVQGRGSSGGLTGGRIVGTLAYMAPEQLESLPVDARADLYAVGAILYELLTGEAPFDHVQFSSLARAIVYEPPPHPRSLNPGGDPLLAAFAATLLAKRPWQRFATAERALAALDDRSAPGAGEPRPPDLHEPDFVGRDAELRLLREQFAAAGRGAAGPVIVWGEPGAGKSRLLAEAAVLAHECGLLTEIADRGGRDADPGTPGARDPRSRLPADAPALAVLADDLERFEPPAARALADLARASFGGEARDAPPPLVLVVTADPAAAASSPALRALVEIVNRHGRGAEIHLAPLARDETAALVRSLLGETRVPPGLVDWLQDQTGGNPAFVEETVRDLVRDGWLLLVEGRLTLDRERLGQPRRSELEPADFAGLPLARGASELLLRPLAGIDARVRLVASAAALAGSQTDFDALTHATGLGETELEEALRTLLARRFLVRIDPEGERYRFAHDRAREALASGMDAATAVRLHAGLARAIEAQPAERRDRVALANHYDRAGLVAEAASHLPAAAERLAASGAHAEAANAWARWLELAPDAGPASRLRARRLLAHELGLVGRTGEARAVLEALLAEARQSEERMETLEDLAFLESRTGRFADALARGSELLALARRDGGPLDQGRALRTLATIETQAGRYADAERSFEQAAEMFRRADDRVGIAAALRGLGTSAGSQGRLVEAAERLQAALAHLAGSSAPLAEQATILELGTVHLNQGVLDRAIECYVEALALAERLGRGERIATACCNLGYVLALAGDHDEAERAIARCLRHSADGCNPVLEAAGLANRAMLRRMAGDHRAALDDVRAAGEALGDVLHPGLLVELWIERARIEGAMGRGAAARRGVREALRLARGHRLAWYEALARVALAETLEGPAALEQAGKARRMAAHMSAALLQAQALVRESALEDRFGSPERAARRREDAATLLRAIGARLGHRERAFLRTPLCREVLGPRAPVTPARSAATTAS